jgi:L(+)-tartrate dehydratase beta subunit
MDSHGGSLFADVQRDVASRRDAVIESLGAA